MTTINRLVRAASFMATGLIAAAASFEVSAFTVVPSPQSVPAGTTFIVNAGEVLDGGIWGVGGTVLNLGISPAMDAFIGLGTLINQGVWSWTESVYISGGGATGTIRNDVAVFRPALISVQ